ncbi:MAG: DUF1905 domain-containing protein, partial [Sphingomonadales bacterium]
RHADARLGALKCEPRIGMTCWNTMVVPGDNESWLLPVKRAVRDAGCDARSMAERAASRSQCVDARKASNSRSPPIYR